MYKQWYARQLDNNAINIFSSDELTEKQKIEARFILNNKKKRIRNYLVLIIDSVAWGIIERSSHSLYKLFPSISHDFAELIIGYQERNNISDKSIFSWLKTATSEELEYVTYRDLLKEKIDNSVLDKLSLMAIKYIINDLEILEN